ncbi:MAG: NAD(P)/FAD-dependent oxidoreductase [Bacteroidota bacterium]
MKTASPVIIVGAGPGGLYAALCLAQLGIPSTVLERATFPRKKACGDILTSNVLRALHELDPALLDRLLAQDWSLELNASTFASHQGNAVEVPFNSPSNQRLGLPSCIAARRTEFDNFFYEYAAADPQVDIRPGCAVQSAEHTGNHWQIGAKTPTGTESFSGKMLLIAAGANSPLVQTLVPGHQVRPRHSAVGLRAYFSGVTPGPRTDRSEFYLFDRKFMPGGVYITPFADDLVNANLVLRYDIFRKRKTPLRELLEDYIATHPELAPRFRDAHLVAPPQGSRLSFGTRKRPLSAEGCLLIGDAAGLTDATNANGIGHAMISGRLAAQATAEAIVAGKLDQKSLRHYDKAVYQRLHNALLPGKVMRYLFANRVVSHLSASLLQSSFRRLNGKAIEELVYAGSTTKTLIDPRFYLRLFSKEKAV